MNKTIRMLFISVLLVTVVTPVSSVATECENLSITESAAPVETSPTNESSKSATTTNVSSELLCSIISFAGIVVSALISKNVSKNTTAKEIEKMKLSWNREDFVASEDEFSKMTSAVAKYAGDFRESSRRIALGEIASIRARETGDLAAALDQLYQTVLERHYSDINKNLTDVIAAKRMLKCKDSSSEPS